MKSKTIYLAATQIDEEIHDESMMTYQYGVKEIANPKEQTVINK